ncbi:MAG TPA: DUF3291 domain-containing protein [Bryobacteraceae bacterium]|nr:DUF3291 domain-containing protein [Bryobacteraceae bacterium]
MSHYHIAQVNIGRVKAFPDDPLMAGFMNRLDEINALAETSPGFVWRLKTSEGNATYATYFRPYDDERILVNMSVWESIDALKQYVYGSVHMELLRRRHEWFERFTGSYLALWWVRASHLPGIDRRTIGFATSW